MRPTFPPCPPSCREFPAGWLQGAQDNVDKLLSKPTDAMLVTVPFMLRVRSEVRHLNLSSSLGVRSWQDAKVCSVLITPVSGQSAEVQAKMPTYSSLSRGCTPRSGLIGPVFSKDSVAANVPIWCKTQGPKG